MYRFNGPSDKSSSDLYGTDEDVNYNEPDPKEAKHVVFVIIGKGRTPEEEELQAKATNQIKKAFKIQDPDNSSKVIFMPINWTLGLNLSQETMESIKPSCSLDMQRMRRNFEDALFDVVFYVAPIFFAEIQLSLTEELSKAWKTLSDKGFQGKVSLMANGLASVMVYDTITGNDPPKAVNPVYIPRSYDSGEVNELFQELGEARGSVGDVKGRISSFCAKNLDFSIANIFLLGSPIGMFMAMRGIRAGELKLPYNTKVFNIYDQSDIFVSGFLS
ncbi:DgyrCDS10061 [Dimorphilus gyrociliatus]|uniref:DgyrCDS10061 n=1 Tax=Dimorphilus gyrociliatus TaxID=2664684 RepID=A0A7I8W0I0_9ANNE|nr:DgyrCDS10061 [Dimorphilus gyrociliatus]